MNKRNLILFVNFLPKETEEIVRRWAKEHKLELELGVIVDSKKIKKTKEIKNVDLIISCDYQKSDKVAKALQPYEDRLLALVCRLDKNVPDFSKLVAYAPYIRTPSTESLLWSVDKLAMRRHFHIYDPKITPKFLVVDDNSKATLEDIKHKISFPLVIKPTGLGASILVTICWHAEELEDSLKKIFKKLQSQYKHDKVKTEPKLIVEEFMEGTMYSLDAYVSSRGKITFCPLVHIKTGHDIGFDDFFGYQQLTPTKLKKTSIEEAEVVASKAIKALKLRSITVHVELIKTEDGFKVIELGPRIGGFRHELYQLSYGINHILNDVLIRIPKAISVPKQVHGYSVAMKFFPQKEGRLERFTGAKKLKQLDSFYSLKQNKKVGDMCRFAKNGGRSVCNLIMFNPDRSELLADIRRAEKLIKIIT